MITCISKLARCRIFGLLACLALAAGAGCRERTAGAGSRAEAEPTPLDGEIVLELAIAAQDPEGIWHRGRFAFRLEEVFEDGPLIRSDIELDNSRRAFRMRTERDGREVEIAVLEGDVERALVDGSAPVSDEERRRFGLDRESALRTRNSYLFRNGLPMKLRDPGARVDRVARRVTWQDREALEVRVAYEPPVGTDVWIVYVEPATYAVLGYRVLHDPEKGTGESIVLDGQLDVSGLLMPRVRRVTSWPDGRFLRRETISPLESGAG